MKNKKYSVEEWAQTHPNWFKLKIVPRRLESLEPEEFAYLSGLTSEQVRREAQESLGLDYIVTAEKINYDKMIQQIGKSTNEVHP